MRISPRHTLTGGDSSVGRLGRSLANVGNEHHVHVHDFRLEIALHAGGPSELVLGEYGYGAVERRPQ